MFAASTSDSLFWIATAICAVAQVAVIRAAMAGRTPGASSTTLARSREFFWVLLPAGLLVLLLAWTWQSLPGRFLDRGARPPNAAGALSSAVTVTS